MPLKCAFERGESLLCACQVAGLESLADGGEVLGPVGAMEGCAIAQRSVLPKRYQAVIRMLRGGFIAGLQCCSQLIERLFALMPESVLLINLLTLACLDRHHNGWTQRLPMRRYATVMVVKFSGSC